MKNNITIEARRFPVAIRDERTGEVSQDHIVLDKRQLQAAQLVGQGNKEIIWNIYNRQGFRVLEIGKAEKRSISVSLDELWDMYAANETTQREAIAEVVDGKKE